MPSKTAATKPQVLGLFALTSMCVAAVMSLKNIPVMAEYGLALIFYVLFATLFFFIPVSLVAAELATGWPQKGGIYIWVSRGLGPRWGVAAVWFHWVESFFWYPTAFAFVAATVSYIFNPELADNKLYNVALIIACMWVFTLINLGGTRLSSLISTVGVFAGTIIPAALIVLLGIVWVSGDHAVSIHFSMDAFFPDLKNMAQIALLAGMALVFVGIELIGYHAGEVKNPQRNFSRAIFLAAGIIIMVYVAASLSIAIVIPQTSLSLTAGVMEAMAAFMHAYHLDWLTPWIAFLIMVGVCAQASTWITGPARGIEAPASDGYIPPILARTNQSGAPCGALFIQAAAVTLVTLFFLFMPSVNSAMWLLIALLVQVYILMYFLMFAAAIRLRYTRPDVKRSYQIPGGKPGIWLVAGIGFLSCFFTFLTGFWPKAGIDTTGKIILYEVFLIGGMVTVCAPAFIFYAVHKPEWKIKAISINPEKEVQRNERKEY